MQSHAAIWCNKYTYAMFRMLCKYKQQALFCLSQCVRWQLCLSYWGIMRFHKWCLLSHLHKGACLKCLQCMSVVPAVMWCNKCTFQDDLVPFVSLVCSVCGVFGYLRVSRNLSPVVPEVSLVIWGSGFLLQILSHAQLRQTLTEWKAWVQRQVWGVKLLTIMLLATLL